MSQARYPALFLSLVLPVTTAAGRTFYVDPAGGDDTNPGTAPTRPWASLARVNEADLRPGDTVRFRRGGTWRGTLRPRSGEKGAPVTYTGYGDGDKPLLLGSASAGDPADWVQTGEHTWATREPAWTPQRIISTLGESDWDCHREHNARVTLTTRDTERGRVQVLTCERGGDRSNHIQLWGPAVDWRKAGDTAYLLFRFRGRCTRPFRTGPVRVLRREPPWTTCAAADPAGPRIGTAWKQYAVPLAINSRGDRGHLHMALGATLPAGGVFELEPLDLAAAACSRDRRLDVDVGNIIFDHGAACGWKRWSIKEVGRPGDYFYDAAEERVFAYAEKNPGAAHDSIELALRRHIVDQGGRHDVVYDGLALRYGAAHGFGGGNTARLVIRNCDLSYIGGGHQLTKPDGTPVRFGNAVEFWGACRDHLVEGCRIWEVYDAGLTNQGRGPDSVQENITYRNNLVRNCEYSFEYWNNPETARTRNIRFVNNTCIDAGVVWSHAQRPDPNGSHLMFYTNRADSAGIVVRYNVFYRCTEWGSRYSAGWDPLPDMDYNAWYLPAAAVCYFFREHIKNGAVAEYRRRTGLDRHSFFGDPKLVDPARGDYRLAPDSPARDLHPGGGTAGASFAGDP